MHFHVFFKFFSAPVHFSTNLLQSRRLHDLYRLYQIDIAIEHCQCDTNTERKEHKTTTELQLHVDERINQCTQRMQRKKRYFTNKTIQLKSKMEDQTNGQTNKTEYCNFDIAPRFSFMLIFHVLLQCFFLAKTHSSV